MRSICQNGSCQDQPTETKKITALSLNLANPIGPELPYSIRKDSPAQFISKVDSVNCDSIKYDWDFGD
jgi:hypothetical protein